MVPRLRCARARVWGRPQARRRRSRRAPASWGSPTITGAVKDILAGNVGALAAKVESVLASTIPIVLDFLASLLGIADAITGTIQKALKAVTEPIQNAIDAILLAIKNAIGGFIDKILGRGGKDDAKKADEVAPGTPMTEDQIIKAVVPVLSQPTVATDPAAALEEKKTQAGELKKKFQPSAPEGKTLHIEFKDRSAEDVEKDHKIAMSVGFSPDELVEASTGEGACGQGSFTSGPSRSGVGAIITPSTLGGGAEPRDPIGWYKNAFTVDKLQRGHVYGKQFGGSGEQDNVVAMPGQLNNPDMVGFENEVATAVKAGNKVEYGVKLSFGGPAPIVTHRQAVELAKRAGGFSRPTAIEPFEGTIPLPKLVATGVTMSAKILVSCPAEGVEGFEGRGLARPSDSFSRSVDPKVQATAGVAHLFGDEIR